MTTTLLLPDTDLIADDGHPCPPDEAQLAVAALLARHSGRTLEAYRHDLRYYFQWAADQHQGDSRPGSGAMTVRAAYDRGAAATCIRAPEARNCAADGPMVDDKHVRLVRAG